MSENSMTMSERVLLEKCREVELLCRKLYLYFADLYAGNEDIARLWKKTADEELNHAEQFSLALRLCKGLSCQVLVNSKNVELILSRMIALIDKVELNPPGLLDALCSAVRLENYLAEFHLGCVVLFEDINYKKMFDAMMASDKAHIASLQAAYERLAGS